MTDPERAAYDALCCYTLAHRDPAFIHQHVVDAFAVQRADADTQPIALCFGLVGLYLRVERGATGRQVQRVHMALARRRRAWPAFALPADRGEPNAADVMRAPPGPERDRAIDAWCAGVWAAFRDQRAAVDALLAEHGFELPEAPGPARARRRGRGGAKPRGRWRRSARLTTTLGGSPCTSAGAVSRARRQPSRPRSARDGAARRRRDRR